MKKLIYVLAIVLILPLFAGCKRTNPQTKNNEWYINCTSEEKAADVCTMIYSPVCGDDWETYWNSCVACSSQKINSYKMWECNCESEDWICNTEISENIENEIPETIIEVPLPNF